MQMKILGINDEQTTCDKCGKTNLKKTVIIEIEGEVVRYGCDCAANFIHGNKKHSSMKMVENLASAIEYAKSIIKQYGAIQTSIIIGKKYGYGFSTKNGKLFDFNRNEIASE